ncbi:CFA44 protein, partial [Atractosteus spatula]|nr:CFA44 protein [Atractosteus spatula]
MSFVRGSRSCQPGRKATRVRKKKAAGQQDWVVSLTPAFPGQSAGVSPALHRQEQDSSSSPASVTLRRCTCQSTLNRVISIEESTIQDLSVHRATPEELSRRHELHRSKNRAAAQWELRERALRGRRPASPDPLERARLAIMREVLSEQYRMQDVLERSDRALAVVKDLFGDAPRRQTGFPNVTVAPDCDPDSSVMPVLQRPDPPTQLSILSQSIMDPQALNEVCDESPSPRESECSEEEGDPSESVTFNSNIDISRYSRYLREKEPIGQQGRPGDQQHSLSHAPLAAGAPRSPHTPLSTAVPSGERAALNATAAVQRVRPRRQAAAPSPASPRHSSALVTHILNPHPRPRRAGKKSKPLGSSRRRCEEPPGLDSSAVASLSSNQSSLELLQSMLGEVEQELDSLDHQDPHSSVAPPHRAPGLTGFSVSLVSTLRRLAQHLRQSDRALQGEMAERRRLEEETREQRSLIDALTAEALALREENSAMQVKLQQHIAATEQQLSSVREGLRALGVKTDFEEPQSRLAADTAAIGTQSTVPTAILPGNASPEQGPSGTVLPQHLFHPAVLLSPPRQRDSLPARTAPSDRQVVPPSVGVTSQRTRDELEELSVASSFASLPSSSLFPKTGLHSAAIPESPRPEQAPAWKAELSQLPSSAQKQESLLGHITELSRQNSLIRAQLGQFRSQAAEAAVPQENKNTASAPARKACVAEEHGGQVRHPDRSTSSIRALSWILSPESTMAPPSLSVSSVEQRIAELNRQSAEARGRLLELIEQQRRVSSGGGVSPSISPIPSPPLASLGAAEDGREKEAVDMESPREEGAQGETSDRELTDPQLPSERQEDTGPGEQPERGAEGEEEDAAGEKDQEASEARDGVPPVAEGEPAGPDTPGTPPEGGELAGKYGPQEPSINAHKEEEEGEDSCTAVKKVPRDFYYEYEELCSKPFVSPDSGIPTNLLQLLHSFGYDCTKRANLQLLDENTLAFVAGNLVILLDWTTKEQRYLRSCSGGGIGTIMVHPSKNYFAVAEKGTQPDIIIYEYPSLRPYRKLRGGTEEAYSCVDFNSTGSLLASVGSNPDYMLTLWDWQEEQVVLRSKAFSQDIYRVTFSPDNPGQLTSSGSGHIKFWKMASTFTGLKLQGMLGRFGKTALTDIDGYVELPDGKVVSGSEWGNMLLWDGGLIKVEICRKGGRPCHLGPIQQFVLDEGELLTVGTDGAIRVWDFEGVDSADSVDDSGLFEIEPMNEIVIGKRVSLYSMVRGSGPDSFIWFAQDAQGAIWKLDLSFSNITQDPECLFSFHSGIIQGMDVSTTSHLMATTALDRSVRIFDFLAKKELTTGHFRQGGTTLTWAPRMVNPKGGLMTVGFQDGVVRLLEVYNPLGLSAVAGISRSGAAEIRLKQAFKPHTGPVTAIAYERNGEILATGSLDKTVFFFTVGERYEPIGFVNVLGPVQGLDWSPSSHERSTLLVLCENGHVVEVPAPDPELPSSGTTYQIRSLPTRHFHFRSIKSRIRRDAEVAHRREEREQRQKEREERLRRKKELGQELTEEDLQEQPEPEEDELPPLHIPDPPSPLLCGLYSQPGAFWLSMGGYDSGFLYHCKFSEQQDAEQDPLERQDEPFSFLPVQDTDRDPIRTMSFSSNRQLLLCGMQSGQVRVYPLQPDSPVLPSMQGFWALSVHDNQYGALRRVCCSHDDQFVLTAGEDGNIFVFSLLPQEDLHRALEKKRAKVPSPREGLEKEKVAEDIEDPNAYSIETAKQKSEMDRMRREAEERRAGRRRKLSELEKEFRQLLLQNQSLPEHVRLDRAEFELDPRIREETERLTAQRVRAVRKELAWEEEKHRIGLQKLQERFWDSLESDTVIVRAFGSDYKVSTYRLLALSRKYHQLKQKSKRASQAGQERRRSRAEYGRDSSYSEEERDGGPGHDAMLQRRGTHAAGTRLAGRQAEKLQKAMEKAERARAKIEKRKKEWEELYASKPDENFEDPRDVEAIKIAQDNMGDFKLKTAKDFTVPEHLRMNAEKKRVQLVNLEEKMHDLKTDMNEKIMSLRNSKVESIRQIRDCVLQLRTVQSRLDPAKRLPVPSVPTLLPEEMPERKMRYTRDTLLRYKQLRAKHARTADPEGGEDESGFLGLELAGREQEEMLACESPHREGTPCSSESQTEQYDAVLTDLEEEMQQAEEIRHLYLQESLLQRLDIQMKLVDLQHVTLFQELLLLKEFEKRENILQERVNTRIGEELELQCKYEECQQQLEAKKRDISKLQEKERAIAATFQASLGENNKFADFLTKVFKKKIKRVKKKERKGDEEEEVESEEESDEESDWGSDEEDSGSETGPLDDSVCPPNCNPELFDSTIELREKRLDIEEALMEEKKIADSLKKECDSLVKKATEGELELFQREKQQKLNELDVVVPLRLHQIEYVNNGTVPSKLSQALIFNMAALVGLQQRIRELQLEKSQQRELYRQARQEHVQLIHDKRDMTAKIQVLEEKCQQLMMMKFGKEVDLEALQTLSINRNLEELKQESQAKEADNGRELQLWEAKVQEAKEILTEVTRQNTQRLLQVNQLLTERKDLEERLNARQRKMQGGQFQGRRRAEEDERQRLIQLVETQAQEAEALREEIGVLSRKGGHILPPAQPPQPPRALSESLSQLSRRGGIGHRSTHSRPSVPASGQGLG